jgi:hypothetical protein
MLWIISRPGQSLAGDQPATRYSLNHTDGKTLGECSRILQSAEKRWTACTKQPISRIFSYASASHRGRKSSDIFATPSFNITNHQRFTAGAQSPQAPRTDVANALTFFSIIGQMVCVFNSNHLGSTFSIGGVSTLDLASHRPSHLHQFGLLGIGQF